MLRRHWIAVALAQAGSAQSSDLIAEKTVLENQRVTVVERVMAAGASREPFIRETDQVIVFLNDCVYDRIDADTGETSRRTRKAGETIWHFKGEHAPRLVNRGEGDFRSLVIELK